jgi:hypothetical protein
LVTEKYDNQAATWTETAYADAATYLSARADAIVALGPRLERGDALLDLACGDAGLADFLPSTLNYSGVDASDAMVAAARSRGRDVVRGDLNEFVPSEPVAATTCFRAIYYARDRRAFFEHVRAYTTKKLVFDLNPRQYRLADVRADALAAGFAGFFTAPLFVPQRRALPQPFARLLRALEQRPAAANLVLRARFTYVCAASSVDT